MLAEISIVVSVASLALSAYTLYYGGRPGPVGPQGPPGEKSGPAPSVVPPAPIQASIRTTQPDSQQRPQFKTKAQRREDIKAEAGKPDFEAQLNQVRERLRDGSGLIKPDPDAQLNAPDWRKRNAR
jgi:hypothetical protein